ncbi:MAG: sigma-70 family RNA polymerase sigma factor [Nocardioidaceae bacterium]
MSSSTLSRTRPAGSVPAIARHRDRPRAASSAAHLARSERTAALLLKARDADPEERQRLVGEAVTANMPMAAGIASRFRTRGIASDDLEQVAYLALVKAAHGFDPEAGHDFSSYAVPTIRGEIKRHFRDRGWTVRPPRRIQELQARITAGDAVLTQSLGRSPRPSEIAAHLGEAVEEVGEALASVGCFTPSSLDRPVGEDGSLTVSDLLGGDDCGPAAVDARVVLAPVVRRLGERDRRILLLRFFRGLTQQEIAEDIGVTQMQVSRLLTRILRTLRSELGEA